LPPLLVGGINVYETCLCKLGDTAIGIEAGTLLRA
jgi:hypothetical protein